jgi:hypothetical protein
VNPTSYPGSPFPGACHPLPSNPNVQSLRDWVEAAPEWAQGQQPWLLITALSLMHPWVLWAVLVVLGSAPDVPPLP